MDRLTARRLERVAHLGCGTDRAEGVVLVQDRDAEHGHDLGEGLGRVGDDEDVGDVRPLWQRRQEVRQSSWVEEHGVRRGKAQRLPTSGASG